MSVPETAEACLRSRYSAYALGEVDFILESHHSSTRAEVSRSNIADWSRNSEWLGLRVLETEGGGPQDEEGSVTFSASYRQHGKTVDHTENAQFEKEDGAWRFLSSATPPFRRSAPKVGRNDPCPCGSGKKYKRCCGR
ncbi:YchJ family protein [Planctomycetota bacterium]